MNCFFHSPVTPRFRPDHFLIVWLLASLALITIPAPLWHVNVQTLPMECSRARLTAQKATTYKDKRWVITVVRTKLPSVIGFIIRGLKANVICRYLMLQQLFVQRCPCRTGIVFQTGQHLSSNCIPQTVHKMIKESGRNHPYTFQKRCRVKLNRYINEASDQSSPNSS